MSNSNPLLQAVQQRIKGVKNEISEVEASLTAAEQAEDVEQVRQLFSQLGPLYRAWVACLEEKKNLLLQADRAGEHGPFFVCIGFCCYFVTVICCNH